MVIEAREQYADGMCQGGPLTWSSGRDASEVW